MTHVADGDLIRWLDDECDAAERTDVAHHFEHCDQCRARLSETRRRAELVRGALRRGDAGATAGTRRAAWSVRAAAAVILLVALGAAVTPVRAWVVGRATAAWRAVVNPSPGTDGVPVPQAQPVGPSPRATVTFLPAGEVFVVEVTARQAEGRLVVESGATQAATATVEGGDGSEQLVVLPSGLRVVNGPHGRASYWIRLPPLVRSVHAVIADEQPIRFALRSGGSSLELPLERTKDGTAEAGPGNR